MADNWTPPLAGIDLPDTVSGRRGYVERALAEQVEAMRETGELDNRHSALVALAHSAARQVDSMGEIGRPSGRANMLRAAREVFELLPEATPEAHDAMQQLNEELAKLAGQGAEVTAPPAPADE